MIYVFFYGLVHTLVFHRFPKFQILIFIVLRHFLSLPLLLWQLLSDFDTETMTLPVPLLFLLFFTHSMTITPALVIPCFLMPFAYKKWMGWGDIVCFTILSLHYPLHVTTILLYASLSSLLYALVFHKKKTPFVPFIVFGIYLVHACHF